MKKSLVIGLAIGLVSVVASSAFAGKSATLGLPTAGGVTGQKNFGGKGIVGTSHDLSNVGNTTAGAAARGYAGGANGDTQSRICVYCHHPHNAYAADNTNGSGAAQTGGRTGAVAAIGSYSPLWNRQMSTQSFVGYNNGIMMGNSTVTGSDKRHALNAGTSGTTSGSGTSITGVSLLCMSCHDGVVAMSAYSVVTGSTGQNSAAGMAIGSSAGFKGNMNNHHPMGFSYAAVQNDDAEIADESTIMVPDDGQTGQTSITGKTRIGDLLYGANKTMECVTCHDVHNTANQTNAERFLWRSNNKSNFCLTCHLK